MAKLASRLVPYVLIGMVAISVFWQLGRWDAWLTEANRRLDAQTASALEAGNQWRGRLVAAEKLHNELGTELAATHATLARRLTEADSIAVIIDTVTLDSSTDYRTLYGLRTAETVRLRAALVASDSVRAILAAEVSLYRVLALEADTTIGQLQQALQDERSARQCRILGILPCPSRTTAFVIGAAGGLVLGVALTQ